MQAQAASTSTYLNTPALDQGMQVTVVAPNDRAGNQGIGQNSTDFGMGGQYGQNLITDTQAAKKRDLQKAKSFRLPTSPDRPGTVETPYLSLGIGVDASRSYGGATPTVVQSTPTVIPYLSHGIGVNPAQFSGSPVRPDDRAGARPSVPTSPTSFAAPVSPTGDGFSGAAPASARPVSRRSRWPSDSLWFLGAAAATRASRSRRGLRDAAARTGRKRPAPSGPGRKRDGLARDERSGDPSWRRVRGREWLDRQVDRLTLDDQGREYCVFWSTH